MTNWKSFKTQKIYSFVSININISISARPTEFITFFKRKLNKPTPPWFVSLKFAQTISFSALYAGIWLVAFTSRLDLSSRFLLKFRLFLGSLLFWFSNRERKGLQRGGIDNQKTFGYTLKSFWKLTKVYEGLWNIFPYRLKSFQPLNFFQIISKFPAQPSECGRQRTLNTVHGHTAARLQSN